MEDNKEQQVQSTESKKNKLRILKKVLLILLSIVVALGVVHCVISWEYYCFKFRNIPAAIEEFLLPNAKKPEKLQSCMVFVEKINIVRKISEDRNGIITFSNVRELSFGTAVEIDLNNFLWEDNKTYYRVVSTGDDTYVPKRNYKNSDDFYLELENDIEDLAEGGYIKEFLYTFPLKTVQQLPVVPVKRAILEYLTSNDYFGEFGFTQDVNRIKKAVVFADFNSDGEQDVAVVLEDKYQNNRLLVFCYNKDLGTSYVAHSDYNVSPAVINSFKKDAIIFINSENLVKSPNNGIIYEMLGGAKRKYAIFYNPKTMQFEQYDQRPLSEIQGEDEHEREYEEETEQDSE